MLVAPEAFAAFLAGIEADLHRQGWDAEPTVLAASVVAPADVPPELPEVIRAICDDPHIPGPSDDGGGLYLTAQALPINFDRAGRSFAEILCDTAATIAYAGDLPGFLDELAEGFVGFVYTFESWIKPAGEGPDYDPSRPLADQVGSRELRTVAAVDVDDAVYTVCRIRGDEPQTHIAPVGDGHRSGGLIIEGLRLATVAVCSRLNPDAHHMPPLAPRPEQGSSFTDLMTQMQPLQQVSPADR